MEEENSSIPTEQKKEENKTENKVISKPKGNFTKKLRKNPWIISTLVLGILTLILVAGNFPKGMTVNIVSEGDIGDLALDFFNNKLSENPGTLESIEEVSGIYKIEISVENQGTFPLYFTKNGEWISQGGELISIIEIAQPSQQNSQIQDIPKSDKPVVELFVMSFCPYGMEAQKIFYPVMDLLGDKVDFRVRFVYYTMHGKKEIDENFIQYCIQEEEPNKYTNYLSCFLESEDTDKCLNNAGISKIKIDNCISKKDEEFKITERYNDQSTWLSGRYPLFDIEKEIGDSYGVQGSESLIINGVKIGPAQYRWSPEKLKQIICSSFENAPEECSKSLEAGSQGSAQGQC